MFGLRLGLPKKSPSDLPATRESPSVSKGGGGNGKSERRGGALTVNEFVARTKKCREKGQEPTKPELIAYARYLGIEPLVDGDLMWIADEALNAPLPSEWTEHQDSADRVFYYNVNTHASSWTHPLEQLHRDTYKNIVAFRSGDLTKEGRASELEKLRRRCEEAEREAHRELQAWTEHEDEQGQKFYYNREQQRSVWTDPRPATCHSLYLQMKALRVLSKHCGQTNSNRGPEPLGDGQLPDRNSHLGRSAYGMKMRIQQSLSHLGTDGATREEDTGDRGSDRGDHGRGEHGRDRDRGHSRAERDRGDRDRDRGNRERGDRDHHHHHRDRDRGDRGERSEHSDRMSSVSNSPMGHRSSSGNQSDRDRGERSERSDRGSGGGERQSGDRRKRKKHHRGERHHSDPEAGQGMHRESSNPSLVPDLGVDSLLGGGDLKQRPLDLRKPSLTAVEEVRSALGVGPGLPLRGPLMDNSRLPTPPGDGLSSVGRAKVRAGIRLEPLKGGA